MSGIDNEISCLDCDASLCLSGLNLLKMDSVIRQTISKHEGRDKICDERNMKCDSEGEEPEGSRFHLLACPRL